MGATVEIKRGKHHHPVPNGIDTLLGKWLTAAGFEGTFLVHMCDAIHATGMSKRACVVGRKPYAVVVKVQPGDNASRRRCKIIMRNGISAIAAEEKLRASAELLEEEGPRSPWESGQAPVAAPPEPDRTPTTIRIEPEKEKNPRSIVEDEQLLVCFLSDIRDQAGEAGTISSYKLTEIIRSAHGAKEMEDRTLYEFVRYLVTQGWLEGVVRGGAKRVGRYRLSTKALNTIGSHEGPSEPQMDEAIDMMRHFKDKALEYMAAQPKLLQIRAELASLEEELGRLATRRTELQEEEKRLAKIVDDPSGKRAAMELEKMLEELRTFKP